MFILDNPEWGEFWIFCWLAMNTSQTPSHVPTFPSVSPLTVSNYPSGPMALQSTRIHWCAAIKSRAQLHSTAQHTCTARSSTDKDCMIATGSEDWPGIVNVTVNTVRLSGLFLLLWCKWWQWTWYVHVTPCPSPPARTLWRCTADNWGGVEREAVEPFTDLTVTIRLQSD